MSKKSKTDKQLERRLLREQEEYEIYRGRAGMQELRRSLENFQRIKEQHRAYIVQHGRTWLNHSQKH